MTSLRTPAEHAVINQTAGSAPVPADQVARALDALARAVRSESRAAIHEALEMADQVLAVVEAEAV